MTFKAGTKMLFLDGKPIPDGEDELPLLAGQIAIRSLLAGNEKEPGDKKLEKWDLATKIKKALDKQKKDVELTSEEVVLIKSKVAEFYSTLIYGRMHDLLEKK